MNTRLWVLAFLVPVLFSCSSDNGTEPTNSPPTLRWTFSPIAVGRGATVTLSVSVSDEDRDDTHTFTWSASNGTITPVGNGSQAEWVAPNALGTETITVQVSDGTATDEVVEDILVGTPRTSPSLSSNLTAANSPYIFAPTAGTVTVPPQSNITVEAGVVVYFGTAGGSIQVEGQMTTLGTPASHVEFRANDRTINCGSGPGWWVGIQGRSSGRITCNYTEIWYADKGVHLVDSGVARLTNTEIRCSNIGAQISSAGWLVVDSCSIDNNTDVGVKIFAGSSLQPDSVAIRDSNISINGITGIDIDICGSACLAPPGFNVPIAIHRNRIEANFTNGITLARESLPEILYNHFEANGLSGGLTNLRLRPQYPGDQPPGGVSPSLPTLVADNNYWGGAFTDVANIKATIRDREDDTSIGTVVDVTPWLNASPLP